MKLKVKGKKIEIKKKNKVDWKKKYLLEKKKRLLEAMDNQENKLTSLNYLSRIAKIEGELANIRLKDLRSQYQTQYTERGE